MSGKRETTQGLLAWPAVLLLIGAVSAAVPPSPVSAGGVPGPQPVATRGGPLPSPLPLFPSDNWWNVDISAAPLDPNSAAFITFIKTHPTTGQIIARQLHPDFGGTESPGSDEIYGIPYVVVDETQPKVAVQFDYSDESDGVDHNTDTSFPFYPIPPEAITQPHWIEGGPPGNQDVGGDRHMLIVDKDNNHLYELYALHHNGSGWVAGSGAFFDMNTNNRRPEGWTSADAAGLAILPGLVRYDEVFGPDEINHALRFTVSRSKGVVFPASHEANTSTNNNALPMGARLRLKASKNISGYAPEVQKIFRAMKKYGLIMADNGSNMYISGAFDTRWDNGILNPAFHSLDASDFEVVQRGYIPPFPNVTIGNATVIEGNAGTINANFTVTLSAASSDATSVVYTTANGTTNGATAPADFTAATGTVNFAPGEVSKQVSIVVAGDTLDEFDETFFVNLTSPVKLVVSDGQGLGTITDDDPTPTLSINDVAITEGNTGTQSAVFTVTLSAASGRTVTVSYDTGDATAMAGRDFVTASGFLTFSPGTVTRPISVLVNGDFGVEINETFAVNLSSPANATIVDGQGVGTINDNDVPGSRTFVSSGGHDANDCTSLTTPCRSIGQAIFQVAGSGEVIVVATGEYETAPLLITKSVKVTSPSGTVAFVRQPITINAPGERVVLRGLTLKGGGSGNAVNLTAADSLSIEDSTIDRWATGLNVNGGAASQVSLANAVFAANTSGVVVAAAGTSQISIESARFERNGTGLLIHSGSHSVRESSFVGHTAAGLTVDGGSADVQRSEVALNNVGVNALSGGTVRIGRSRVFGNATGLSAAPGSTLGSAGTNVIRRNTTNTTGTITVVPEQ